MNKTLKVLELFAGVGTFSLALKKLGIPYEIVDAVEIDKYAIQAFNAIHETKFPTQDISQWDKDIKVDMITHGSPCQSFSIAGHQDGGDEGSGTRSSLMWETVRIVEKLLSKKHWHNFDAYLKKMESLGYKNFYKVMNAKDYGVPQNRERVFTVSILGGNDFKFPESVPLERKLKDVLEKAPDEKYYLSEEKAGRLKYRNTVSQGDIKRVGDLDIKGQDQIKRVYSPEGVSPTLSTMQGGQRQPKIIQRGRGKNPGGEHSISPTLSTSDWQHNHALEEGCSIRRLTPLECWRLQGHDDDDFEKAKKSGLSDSQLYKIAGNGIAKPCLTGIFKELLC